MSIRRTSFEGLIVTGDIAKSYMDVYDNSILAKARTQYRNIIETLDGKIVAGNEHGYFVKGKVIVGAGTPDTIKGNVAEDDLGHSYQTVKSHSLYVLRQTAAVSL